MTLKFHRRFDFIDILFAMFFIGIALYLVLVALGVVLIKEHIELSDYCRSQGGIVKEDVCIVDGRVISVPAE